MFTLLVCGGRQWHDGVRTDAALAKVRVKYPQLKIVQGGAGGADSLARAWAEANGVEVVTCYADWKRIGLSAGIRRNQQMLDDYQPDGVLAFPGGKGTAHMVKIAKAAGVKVWQPFG